MTEPPNTRPPEGSHADPDGSTPEDPRLRAHRERLEIAVMTGERLHLQWSPGAGDVRGARLVPLSVTRIDGQWRLIARDIDDGTSLTIPLAQIRNLPSPDKSPVAGN